MKVSWGIRTVGGGAEDGGGGGAEDGGGGGLRTVGGLGGGRCWDGWGGVGGGVGGRVGCQFCGRVVTVRNMAKHLRQSCRVWDPGGGNCGQR